MNSFKDVALQILEEAGRPLHIKDITSIAMERGWLKTAGKTPEATMGAQLITDVNKFGEKSRFVKTGPATFARNNHLYVEVHDTVTLEDRIEIQRRKAINAKVSSKQKGDIAEARIAELITLFGEEALACYRPVSDDEGIDLIVKQKGNLKSLFLQIKSRWQDQTGSIVVKIKRKNLLDNPAMGVIVCMFDIDAADIWEYLWYIPAPEFLARGTAANGGELVQFVSGKNIERMGQWSDYLVRKQDLADALLKQMGKF